MNEKACMKRRIYEYCFAIHELVLYLDTHPTNAKAIALLKKYRVCRAEAIASYEAKFGTFVISPDDVDPSSRWQWIDGPWPWENNFLED